MRGITRKRLRSHSVFCDCIESYIQISELEVSLAVQMNAVKPTEDVTALKIELEKFKKKIEELDTNNRDLRM